MCEGGRREGERCTVKSLRSSKSAGARKPRLSLLRARDYGARLARFILDLHNARLCRRVYNAGNSGCPSSPPEIAVEVSLHAIACDARAHSMTHGRRIISGASGRHRSTPGTPAEYIPRMPGHGENSVSYRDVFLAESSDSAPSRAINPENPAETRENSSVESSSSARDARTDDPVG